MAYIRRADTEEILGMLLVVRRMSKSISEIVEKKYKTLDIESCMVECVWSHTYTDWEQIHSPSPRGRDELRFEIGLEKICGEQLQDF